MADKTIGKKVAGALPGVAVILLLAGALTYGGKLAVAEATKPKPVVKKTVVVVTEEPKEAVAAPATSAPAPTPEPVAPTATTNSFVYLRPTASTSGTPLQDLQAGTAVTYTSKSSGLWQQVTVGGQTGYVYKKWLTY